MSQNDNEVNPGDWVRVGGVWCEVAEVEGDDVYTRNGVVDRRSLTIDDIKLPSEINPGDN